MHAERRVERSDNIYEALKLQLAATARRAGMSALALTERQGLEVAVVGDAAAVEEIGALAPQLAPGARFWQGRLPDAAGGAARLVTVAPVSTGDGPLFLCAVGGSASEIGPELIRSGLGVCRILS